MSSSQHKQHEYAIRLAGGSEKESLTLPAGDGFDAGGATRETDQDQYHASFHSLDPTPATHSNIKDDYQESAHARAKREEKQALASDETRTLHYLRLAALVILLIMATTVSLGSWYIIRKQQLQAFASDFEAEGQKILHQFHSSIEKSFLGSFDALSSSMTSYAIDTGATFPNVTIPDFEARGAVTRIQSLTTYVAFMPLVTDETRSGWEEYSSQAHGYLLPAFVQEVAYKAAQDEEYPEDLLTDVDSTEETTQTMAPGPNPLDSTPHKGFSEFIWGTNGDGDPEAPNTGPYTPMWQVSPVIPVLQLLNFNNLDLSAFNGPYMDVLNSGQASLGVMTILTDPDDPHSEVRNVQNAVLSLGQFRHEKELYANDPVTMAAYPVFDTLDTKTRKVVGILGTSYYWRLLFENLLAGESQGYQVVVKNSFDQAETYRIDGAEARYEGTGDQHDEQFDDLALDTDVAEYVSEQAGTRSRSFTAVGLNSEFISYSIHVYPTAELKRQYHTWAPVIYAIVVACVFLFTTLLFLSYNFLVERRQKLVMSRAVKSGAIVSSLFPKTVRDRLLESERVPHGPPRRNSSFFSGVGETRASFPSAFSTVASKLQFPNGTTRPSRELNLVMSSRDMIEEELNRDDTARPRGLPIADCFKDATIIFADLAGFTNWSSDRKPTDVFGLLETLYGNFDRLATKRHATGRGVFKVETIGDCYVAVTGVPEAQDDHAAIMTKFAIACLSRLNRLGQSLVDEYGPETKELTLRIGLHSGPVTAGVLRGDRSRFQLFGDTVNTAARMESNGMPGRIHCSESTAKCLEEAESKKGKKQPWTLIPREEKITPKGKKEMQTYWIQPTPSCGSSDDGTIGGVGEGTSDPFTASA